MKKIIIACILFGLAGLGNAQETAIKSAEVQTFKAGGTPIAIPPPTVEMSEVGDNNREFMEVFVAPNNRMIATFLLTKDIPKLTGGSDNMAMSKYAMVQVPRRGEHMDCGASDFKEVTDSVREQFGDALSSTMEEVEKEFNRRVKSLDLDEATVSLGKPIQLGCLFSKQDAYGFGMIMPVAMGGENIKMAMGGALMRVKHKILFVYLYSEYKDEETVKWLRKTTGDWADAILKANR